MSWLASAGVAVLTGILGYFVALVVMTHHTRWYRYSSMEGTTALAILYVAVCGAGAGLVIGLVASRFIAERSSLAFLKGLGLSAGIVVAAGLLIAGFSRALADIPVKDDETAVEGDPWPSPQPFEDLGAGSSFDDWYHWARTANASYEREKARAGLAAHPDLVPRMRGLVLDDDDETACEALLMVAHVARPELVAPVRASAHDLVTRIERTNGLPPGAGAERRIERVSHRFFAWAYAADRLREECGADLTAELAAIQAAASVRQDSDELRVNVVECAREYAESWKGE